VESIEQQIEREIKVRIESGWSTRRIMQFLRAAGIGGITEEEVDALRGGEVIAASHLQRKYGDVQIDTMQEMQRVLALARERLDEALEVEDTLKRRIAGDGSADSVMKYDEAQLRVYRALQAYWDKLKEYTLLAAALDRRAPGDLTPVRMPTLREVMRKALPGGSGDIVK